MDAIHFIEREAEAYDEAAVLKNKEEKAKAERSVCVSGRYRSNYCRCMHLFMRSEPADRGRLYSVRLCEVPR